MAEGEVGKVGVAICSIDDMETLFGDIPLDKVTTSMTINATAPILLALYVAVAKKQGADLSKVGGTIQNDILKEYIARGTYIFPPRPSLRLITDVFAWCNENLPTWNTISISGYHMREAGCTAAQEVGFTIADAIAVHAGRARPRASKIDDFAPRLGVLLRLPQQLPRRDREVPRGAAALGAHREGALRREGPALDDAALPHADRRRDAHGAAADQQPRAHGAAGARRPCSAARSRCTPTATTKRSSLPTQNAAELALRTQQIIAYETGVGDTIDPLAGSCYIEHLTDEVERDAEDYMRRIDDMGGALAAVERGFQAQEIHENAYRIQRDIETHRKIVVGVNEFVDEEPPPTGLHQHDITVGDRRKAAARQARAPPATPRKVAASLQRLEEAAAGDANMVPLLIEAVENYVTLGEICRRSAASGASSAKRRRCSGPELP